MIVGYLSLALLASVASANGVKDLVGTWTTKSRSVTTGPKFFDPVKDKLIEPDLTGISYSFTEDGFYESAYYRALANPTNPHCPRGIMQWQHGTYSMNSTGSLHLSPIELDGRQLLSDPCENDIGLYTRYNQTETFNSFKVAKDKYHGVPRLDLKSFDDSPMHPMYLAYKPPEMLPTTPLNHLSPASKDKRHVARDVPSRSLKTLIRRDDLIDPDRWLWFGVFVSALGGIALLYS